MRWGDKEKFLTDVVAQELGHTPQALLDKPELFDDLEEVYMAFNTLSRCRSVPNPIPFSDIAAYYGMFSPLYDVDEFTQLVQAADYEYLTHCATKMKAESKARTRG